MNALILESNQLFALYKKVYLQYKFNVPADYEKSHTFSNCAKHTAAYMFKKNMEGQQQLSIETLDEFHAKITQPPRPENRRGNGLG